MLIDATELSLDLDVLVEIFTRIEMLGNYANLGVSAWHRKIHGLFTARGVDG